MDLKELFFWIQKANLLAEKEAREINKD